jgi:hypothetical protein
MVCRSKYTDEDIDLIPIEEFLATVPDGSKADTDDPHKLMLKRLEHERCVGLNWIHLIMFAPMQLHQIRLRVLPGAFLPARLHLSGGACLLQILACNSSVINISSCILKRGGHVVLKRPERARLPEDVCRVISGVLTVSIGHSKTDWGRLQKSASVNGFKALVRPPSVASGPVLLLITQSAIY